MIPMVYCILGISIAGVIEIQLILFNISLFCSFIVVNDVIIAYFFLFDIALIIFHVILGVIIKIQKRHSEKAYSIAKYAEKLFNSLMWIQVYYFTLFSCLLQRDNPLFWKVSSGIGISGIIGACLFVTEIVLNSRK